LYATSNLFITMTGAKESQYAKVRKEVLLGLEIAEAELERKAKWEGFLRLASEWSKPAVSTLTIRNEGNGLILVPMVSTIKSKQQPNSRP
jgi:hypothetical protein